MEGVIELRDTDVATCIPNPDEGGDITHQHDRESAARAMVSISLSFNHLFI